MLDLSLQDVDRNLATRAFQIFIMIEDPMAGSSTITKILSLVIFGPNRLGVHLTCRGSYDQEANEGFLSVGANNDFSGLRAPENIDETIPSHGPSGRRTISLATILVEE